MPRRRFTELHCHLCGSYLSTNQFGLRYCIECDGGDVTACRQCDNCFRRNFYNSSDGRFMTLGNIDIEYVSIVGFLGLQKHLCTFRSRLIERQQDGHRFWKYLCSECRTLLGTTNNEWKDAWPAYFWLMFSAAENYGIAEEIWKHVPIHWRLWWLHNFVGLGDFHSRVSLFFPEPFFDDITVRVQVYQEQMASGRLVDLITCSNENCYCSVRCPWGCTEFVGECGSIGFHLYLDKFLHAKKAVNTNSINTAGNRSSTRCLPDILVGIRPDYVYYEDHFLGNEEWPIRPCIQIVRDKGPCICTCKEHDGGSKFRYVHVPQNPLNRNLPTDHSDQLAHAVLQPRFVKHMKFRRFNDMYDVVNCRGQYGGMDSCDITDLKTFDSCGLLTFQNELLALFGRPDVKTRLDQLVVQRAIPQYVRDDKLAWLFRMDFDINGSVRSGMSGGTNVSLKDALKLNEIPADRTSDSASSHFSPSWPSKIILCHPMDDRYGSDIAVIPSMHTPNEDFRLLWFMQSLVLYVPTLWECVVVTVPKSLTQLSWHGWLLRYCCLTSGTPYFSNRIIGRNEYKYSKALPSFKEVLYKIDPAGTASEIPLRTYSPQFSWHLLWRLLYSIQGLLTCVGKRQFLTSLSNAIASNQPLIGVTRSTQVLAVLKDEACDAGDDCRLPEVVYVLVRYRWNAYDSFGRVKVVICR